MSDLGAPEARARVLIDQQLVQAGWSVQDRAQIDLVNHLGVAVREAIMAPGVRMNSGKRKHGYSQALLTAKQTMDTDGQSPENSCVKCACKGR